MPTVNPRLFSGVDGGPGEGPDMGGPNAVSTGMMSQEAANAVEAVAASALGFSKGKSGGYEPTLTGFVSVPAMLGNPIGTGIGKGAAKLGGWVVDKAKGLFGSSSGGGYGTVGPNPGLGFGGWGPIGDLAGGWGTAPSSSLADIGFGGFGDGGHGGGAVGMGDVGGPDADAGVVGF